MSAAQTLLNTVKDRFSSVIDAVFQAADEMVTIELSANNLIDVCKALRDEPDFQFEMLIDLCGVDYLEYGLSEWRTEETTVSGFSRGVTENLNGQEQVWDKPRFGVIYHLLSYCHNHRIRLKVYVDGNPPLVPSVIKLWNAANWFEREAFDLYGVVFDGHPDLRRLLTDYGFVGHPFRKDFPLTGEVELRYDAKQQRCVYEPVSIQPRVLVPKVIRSDNRYQKDAEESLEKKV